MSKNYKPDFAKYDVWMSDEEKKANIEKALMCVKNLYVFENNPHNDSRPSMVLVFDNDKLPRTPERKNQFCEEAYDWLFNELLIEKRVDPAATSSLFPIKSGLTPDELLGQLENELPPPHMGAEYGYQEAQMPYVMKIDCMTSHSRKEFLEIANQWKEKVEQFKNVQPLIRR